MQNKNCTWDQYRSAFIELAQKSINQNRIFEDALEYAEPILKRTSDHFDVHHLSKLTGRSAKHIFQVSLCACHYRVFNHKESGGERRIDEPVEDLKYIQRWILHERSGFRSALCQSICSGLSVGIMPVFTRTKS